MKIYQWVYTYSCWNRKKDLEQSIKGFSTFSYSEGLSFQEIDELEQRCSYAPPFGLSPQPTTEEIERLFPVAFYSFTLSSGRKAIVRSNYVGKGFYDGRWGSFISHGLILDSGDWPCYPMELFDAKVFWRDLSDEIKNRARGMDPAKSDYVEPDYLPVLTENDVCPSSHYSPAAVSKFFEDHDRKRKLAFIIDKLVTTDSGQRPIILGAPWNEMPLYFAAVTMFFPLRIANGMTFATYLENPKVGNNNNLYWLVGAEERKANLNIDSIDTNAPLSFYECLLENRGAFQQFLDDLGDVKIECIARAGKLFELLRKKESVPGEEDFLSSLKFALEIKRTDIVLKMLEQVSKNDDVLELSFAGIKHIISDIPDSDQLRNGKNEFIIRRLRHAELEMIRDVISEIDKNKQISFYRKCIDVIGSGNTITPGELLLLLVSIDRVGKDESQTLLLASVQCVCDSTEWVKLLTIIQSAAISMYPAALHLCKSAEVAQESVSNLVQDKDCYFSVVNNAIDRGYEKEALEMLVTGCAGRANDSFFVECISNVFLKQERFASENAIRILNKTSFSHVSENKLDLYFELKDLFDESGTGKYLEIISSRLPIPDKVSSDYGKKLKQIIDAEREITETIDIRRTEFLYWGTRIENNDYHALEDIGQYQEMIPILSKADKEKVAEWLLPSMYKLGTSPEKQRDGLLFLSELIAPVLVARRYLKLAEKSAKKSKAGILEPNVLALFVCTIKLIPRGELLSELLSEFAYIIFPKYDISAFDALQKQIRDLNALSESEQETWSELRELVLKNNKTGPVKRVLIKITRLFKRR